MSFLPHKKFDILCKLSSFFSCHYELGILGTHNSNSASAQYANIQKNVQFRETGRNVSIVKLARSSYFRIIHLYPLAGLFEYLFMLWLHRHLSAKQALNSKQSAKGYERIIEDILRRSGYFKIKFWNYSTHSCRLSIYYSNSLFLAYYVLRYFVAISVISEKKENSCHLWQAYLSYFIFLNNLEKGKIIGTF